MKYSAPQISLGFVARIPKFFTEDVITKLQTAASDDEDRLFKEKFKRYVENYDPKIFGDAEPNPTVITAVLELFEQGLSSKDLEYFLSRANLPDYVSVVNLFALVDHELRNHPTGKFPDWLTDLEKVSYSWGMISNITWICFILGQTCDFYLNPVLNLMSEKGSTLEESLDTIYGRPSWSAFRDELIERSWEMVGHSSKESALKALGL